MKTSSHRHNQLLTVPWFALLHRGRVAGELSSKAPVMVRASLLTASSRSYEEAILEPPRISSSEQKMFLLLKRFLQTKDSNRDTIHQEITRLWGPQHQELGTDTKYALSYCCSLNMKCTPHRLMYRIIHS